MNKNSLWMKIESWDSIWNSFIVKVRSTKSPKENSESWIATFFLIYKTSRIFTKKRKKSGKIFKPIKITLKKDVKVDVYWLLLFVLAITPKLDLFHSQVYTTLRYLHFPLRLRSSTFCLNGAHWQSKTGWKQKASSASSNWIHLQLCAKKNSKHASIKV